MEFEKNFFEFLSSMKAKKIIRDVVKEECRSILKKKSEFDLGGNQKNLDLNKINELQDKISIYEEENKNYCNSLKEIKDKLREKESELNEAQTRLEDIKKEKKCVEIQLLDEKKVNVKISSELKELNTAKNNLEDELTIIRNDYGKLKEIFDKPIYFYELYNKLSKSTKSGLSNVIACDSVLLFIATFTNDDNLKKVWEYTKEILSDNKKQDDVDILKEVFDYFFDLYNQSLVEPIYKRDSIDIGDDYDDEYHARSRESETSGKITKIVLRGYSSINTGKIICKSVVRV